MSSPARGGLWECEAGHVSLARTTNGACTRIVGGKSCGLPVHPYERRHGEPWAQLARLEAALHWYAVPSHYISDSVYAGGGQGPTAADTDGGQRARAALAPGEAGKGRAG